MTKKRVKRRIIAAVLCLILVCLTACKKAPVRQDAYTWIIGVSMSNVMEPWKNQMVSDIRSSVSQSGTINVIFKDAADSVEKQKEDITQLQDEGIDILIVVPNEVDELQSFMGELHKTMPIIVAGIRPTKEVYTTSICFDDYNIGRIAGQYIVEKQYQNEDRVVVLGGPEESLISKNRLKGFQDAVKNTIPERAITYLNGEWLRDQAEDRIKDYLVVNTRLDIVFGVNDEMAYGASIAAEKLRTSGVAYVGVDGFDGEYGGVGLVKSNVLSATVKCPGMGQKAFEAAQDILEEKKVKKDIVLETKLIE